MNTTYHPWSAPARRVVLVSGLLLAGCRTRSAPAPAPAPAATTPAPTAAPQTTPAPAAAQRTDTAPALPRGSDVAPVLTPAQELATLRVPEGYRVELVAAEPLVQDPVAVDFDADGRMYVVEMRGYMPNVKGTGEDRPVGRVVVLEDTDDDGRADRKTVFLDSLVLPRSVKVLDRGVLVAAPPNLYLARDTDGDLKADTRTLVRDDYGTLQSNPEHNANGLLWGLDNWLHNANYAGLFRVRPDGTLDFRAAPSEGQWGVSSDAWGRLYRNSNEDPLRSDLVPEHYSARNPALGTGRGLYEALTRNTSVWPARRTPAVNRGYREGILRPDSTLAQFTSAGSPTTYLGDRLPAELRRSVFVTEPAGNLVGRFVIEEGEDGFPRARKAYQGSEFLASTDERFRPVNVASAPDGTLYVVDMYRGIIQHRVYITDYLEQKILERGLEQPVGLGRIYRVVHSTTTRGPRPQLARATPERLVDALSHPNGWWRFKAQELLVQRHATSVADTLRGLARGAPDDWTRLHALWTLDGLGEMDPLTVERALRDTSAAVRAAAVRVAEPWLARPAHPVQDAVLRLVADRAPVVRRQLAASLGELTAARREGALARVAALHGGDPVVADMVVSGLRGREGAFLARLLAARPTEAVAPTIQALAAAVLRARDAAGAERLAGWAGDASRPRWQRLALLPASRGGFGGPGGPGGEGRGGRGGTGQRAIALRSRPAGLLAVAQGADTALAARARAFTEAVTWPGKGAAAPTARALTREETRLYSAGAPQFAATCAGCHQANGAGLPGVARSLVRSRWVLGTPAQLVRIVQHGKEGEMLMPPVGASLSDEQLAAVLTYVRRSWGNDALPITPAQVSEVRRETAARKRPWTEPELARVR